MQERHTDENRYFKELTYSTQKYILPFIEEVKKIEPGMRVLEIGCGVGGNLYPFIQRGCRVTGVDLGRERIEQARRILDETHHPEIELIHADIFTVEHLKGVFDLIFVHDVIEHIPDKVRFFESLRTFLRPGGVVFLGFPAWQMPFGGHQQICKSRLLSHLPFFHLLPRFMYRGMLSVFGEDKETIDELLSIQECRITIEGCRKYLKKYHYRKEKEKLFFINPHYEVKFGLKPRKLSPLIAGIPYVRNFFCTSCFLIVSDEL